LQELQLAESAGKPGEQAKIRLGLRGPGNSRGPGNPRIVGSAHPSATSCGVWPPASRSEAHSAPAPGQRASSRPAAAPPSAAAAARCSADAAPAPAGAARSQTTLQVPRPPCPGMACARPCAGPCQDCGSCARPQHSAPLGACSRKVAAHRLRLLHFAKSFNDVHSKTT